MRNEEDWKPTKFVERRGRWRGSRDPKMVGPSSRLVADRQSAAYAQAVREHAAGDLLDVGCGDVPLFGAYRDKVTSTTTVDWADGGNSEHIDHYVDLSNDPLPFEDGSFDTLLATDVLEHLAYPDRLFGEMARVLRPGGKLLLGVPFYYLIHSAPHDHHRYTQFRLRLFCEDHGLDVLSLAPYGAGLDVFFDVVGKLMSGTPATRWASGLPAAVMRRPGKRPDSMPLGYLMVAAKP